MIFDLLHNNKLNREIVHKLPGYTSNYYVIMDNLTTTTLPPSTTTLHPGVHLLLEQAVGIAAFFVLLIVFACIVYFCDMCRYVSNCIRDCSCACSCGRKCWNTFCRQRESVPHNTFNNPVKFSTHEVAIV